MATLADLTEEVLLNLEGFGSLQDTIADLYPGTGTGNLVLSSGSVATLQVKSPALKSSSGITPSVIEIGDELMYVKNVAYFAPPVLYDLELDVVRGFRGTTIPTEHVLPNNGGNAIRVNPRFPRIAVKRAINDTITGLYPRLFVVKTTEINYLANRYTYDLPADARNVIAVTVQQRTSSPDWGISRHWRLDNYGGSGSATGKVLEVRDGNPSRKIRVAYTSEPQPLTANSSAFSTVSGLPEWTREVVIYGACWRLVSFMDATNTFSNSAEQRLINDGQQSSQSKSQSMARYFLGMFETRLAEAEARMQDLYPAPRHYIR